MHEVGWGPGSLSGLTQDDLAARIAANRQKPKPQPDNIAANGDPSPDYDAARRQADGYIGKFCPSPR